MKSTFFEDNIEYQLEVNGENWNQGEIISGQLQIINRYKKAFSLKFQFNYFKLLLRFINNVVLKSIF